MARTLVKLVLCSAVAAATLAMSTDSEAGWRRRCCGYRNGFHGCGYHHGGGNGCAVSWGGGWQDQGGYQHTTGYPPQDGGYYDQDGTFQGGVQGTFEGSRGSYGGQGRFDSRGNRININNDVQNVPPPPAPSNSTQPNSPQPNSVQPNSTTSPNTDASSDSNTTPPQPQ